MRPSVAGDVADVRDAVERHQVVLAGGVHLDVLDQHHLLVADVEGGGQHVARAPGRAPRRSPGTRAPPGRASPAAPRGRGPRRPRGAARGRRPRRVAASYGRHGRRRVSVAGPMPVGVRPCGQLRVPATRPASARRDLDDALGDRVLVLRRGGLVLRDDRRGRSARRSSAGRHDRRARRDTARCSLESHTSRGVALDDRREDLGELGLVERLALEQLQRRGASSTSRYCDAAPPTPRRARPR